MNEEVNVAGDVIDAMHKLKGEDRMLVPLMFIGMYLDSLETDAEITAALVMLMDGLGIDTNLISVNTGLH